MLAQDVCGLLREQRIGNDESMGEIWRGHLLCPSIVTVGLGGAQARRHDEPGLIDQLAATASTLLVCGRAWPCQVVTACQFVLPFAGSRLTSSISANRSSTLMPLTTVGSAVSAGAPI